MTSLVADKIGDSGVKTSHFEALLGYDLLQHLATAGEITQQGFPYMGWLRLVGSLKS